MWQPLSSQTPHGGGRGMGHKQKFYHSFYKTTLPFSNTTSLFFLFLCLLTLTKKQMEVIQRLKECHKAFFIQAYFSANTGPLYNSAKTASWTGIYGRQKWQLCHSYGGKGMSPAFSTHRTGALVLPCHCHLQKDKRLHNSLQIRYLGKRALD